MLVAKVLLPLLTLLGCPWKVCMIKTIVNQGRRCGIHSGESYLALTRAEGKEGRDRGRMKPGSGCTEKAESGGRERGFHGGPVVRFHTSTAVGMGSIPGQETKILHAMQCVPPPQHQKKKKKRLGESTPASRLPKAQCSSIAGLVRHLTSLHRVPLPA